MPRQARKKSDSGIYHIMLRGVNNQQIFEEREDYEKFISILKTCKSICEFKIYAYCLMGNHIHLLIQETKEPIELIIKRIATRFVYWYNIKYQRAGHLFQDRFRSEPIDDERYFLAVLRYIHQNPVKAGICQKIEAYNYSSYNEFFKNSYLIDTDFVFEVINKDEFVSFNNEMTTDDFLDAENRQKIKVTDEQAQKTIEKYSKCKSIVEFQALDKRVRDKSLKIFKEKGLSIRQISRLTGTSYYLVQKA